MYYTETETDLVMTAKAINEYYNTIRYPSDISSGYSSAADTASIGLSRTASMSSTSRQHRVKPKRQEPYTLSSSNQCITTAMSSSYTSPTCLLEYINKANDVQLIPYQQSQQQYLEQTQQKQYVVPTERKNITEIISIENVLDSPNIESLNHSNNSSDESEEFFDTHTNVLIEKNDQCESLYESDFHSLSENDNLSGKWHSVYTHKKGNAPRPPSPLRKKNLIAKTSTTSAITTTVPLNNENKDTNLWAQSVQSIETDI